MAAAKSPRPRQAAIRWDRLSRYALLIVFAGLLFLYINPARTYISTMQESKKRAEHVAMLEAEHRKLEARQKELSRDDVVEAEARRLGMVRPGERAFVVRGLPGGE